MLSDIINRLEEILTQVKLLNDVLNDNLPSSTKLKKKSFGSLTMEVADVKHFLGRLHSAVNLLLMRCYNESLTAIELKWNDEFPPTISKDKNNPSKKSSQLIEENN